MTQLGLFGEVIDLGEIGPSQEIAEQDINQKFKERASKIKIKDVKKQLISSMDNLANMSSDMVGCVSTTKRVIDNELILHNDYQDFGGKTMFKKGEKHLRNFRTKAALCVIDGSNLDVARNSLKSLDEIGGCTKILVANADFRILQKQNDPSKSFYPYHDKLTRAMGIKCLPSRSEAYGTTLTIDTIAIGTLK